MEVKWANDYQDYSSEILKEILNTEEVNSSDSDIEMD